MLIISHRGNTEGETQAENTQSAVDEALTAGFDVMVDVWWDSGQYMLGTNAPVESVAASWLRRPRMWCRARNLEAIVAMQADSIHCFWIEDDAYTITSRNGLWCRPGNFHPTGVTIVPGGPESVPATPGGMGGVCTDMAAAWRSWAESNGI